MPAIDRGVRKWCCGFSANFCGLKDRKRSVVFLFQVLLFINVHALKVYQVGNAGDLASSGAAGIISNISNWKG